MSPGNMLNIQGTLGYGWTRNKLDSYYSGGSSNGKWENRMGFATLQATWDHNLNKGWTLSPFLGIEYTQVNQNSFTETGYDPRHFDRGDLKNLSLPVGVGISKSVQFSNGVLWVNSLAVSYVPDVVRDNPETRARRLMNDFSWTARGSRPTATPCVSITTAPWSSIRGGRPTAVMNLKAEASQPTTGSTPG